MNRYPYMICIGLLFSSEVALAQRADQQFLRGEGLKPTADEKRVLDALANSRPQGGPTGAPRVGADKSVRFVYGASLPTIICAPMQICDIELEPGELVRSLSIGDTERWSVEPVTAGVPPREVKHIILRPSDLALRTSLVVTTDRRTYRMKLTSDAKKYMPSVSFSYPSTTLGRWRDETQGRAPSQARANDAGRPARRQPRRKLAEQGSLATMSFGYELEGDSPPWKPVRVYNDGLQTVIEMPFAMRQTEAPTLLIVRAEGGIFSDDEVVLVNFRTDGTKYIVDSVFDVADLIVGVGTTQQKVRIRRK